MNKQLDEMIDEAERQRDEGWALLDGLDDERFSRRPAPDRWCIGEQLAHVPLTDRPYFAPIEASLENARDRDLRSDGPFQGSLVGNWFTRTLDAPVKRRMKTPAKLKPAPHLDRETVRADFVACRGELIELMRSSYDVDLDRAKMRSPFLVLMKFPVYNAYTILLAHARRHIWLAKRTLPEGTIQ